jgi:hypothetical protein
VVEAFCSAEFDGTGDPLIGDVRQLLRYTVWEIYPQTECDSIILKYTVLGKAWQRPTEAAVEVKYEVIGDLCAELQLQNRQELVTYYLTRKKGFWKVNFPAETPYISAETAIRKSEHRKADYKNSPESQKKMEKSVDILRKVLRAQTKRQE